MYEQSDIKWIVDHTPRHVVVQFTDGVVYCSCGSNVWGWV
jgi:hypothetical protein